MDKFSRTTEIDTTGVLNAIEQDAPKKSRRGNIIAFVLCVLAAIVIWLYVMDTDSEIIEKEFVEVPVVVEDCGYDVEIKTPVNITIKGTKGELVDIKRSEIKVVVESERIQEKAAYGAMLTQVPITYYIEDGADVDIVPSVYNVLVQIINK